MAPGKQKQGEVPQPQPQPQPVENQNQTPAGRRPLGARGERRPVPSRPGGACRPSGNFASQDAGGPPLSCAL